VKHITIAAFIAIAIIVPSVSLAQERPANCQPMSAPDRCLAPGGQVYRQFTSRYGTTMWFPNTHRYEDCISNGQQLGWSGAQATDFCNKRRARGDIN
jgi:hypothetical protein